MIVNTQCTLTNEPDETGTIIAASDGGEYDNFGASGNYDKRQPHVGQYCRPMVENTSENVCARPINVPDDNPSDITLMDNALYADPINAFSNNKDIDNTVIHNSLYATD